MELLVSILLLTLVTMIADFGLAFQGDWPRIVRVTLSAASYVAVLGVVLRGIGRLGAPAARIPYWPFALAGTAAGVIGALLPPSDRALLSLAGVVLAALILGGFHWLAIRSWPRARTRH